MTEKTACCSRVTGFLFCPELWGPPYSVGGTPDPCYLPLSYDPVSKTWSCRLHPQIKYEAKHPFSVVD